MGAWGCESHASDHAWDLLDKMTARDRKGCLRHRDGHRWIVLSTAKKIMRLRLKAVQPRVQTFAISIEKCRTEHKMYWAIGKPCAICFCSDNYYEIEQYLGAVIYIVQYTKWKKILSHEQLLVAQDIAKALQNPKYLALWKSPKKRGKCLEKETNLLERSINAG